MYRWIVEADLVRLRRSLGEASTATEAARLKTLIAGKQRLLRAYDAGVVVREIPDITYI